MLNKALGARRNASRDIYTQKGVEVPYGPRTALVRDFSFLKGSKFALADENSVFHKTLQNNNCLRQ